jgi:LacI family transcriptional regulator
VRYIREHACDPCSVEEVLRHVPTGRRWLERQFEKKLGRSPGEEILRVQLQTARRLLLRPEIGLEAVAEKTGFSCSPALSRAFRRTFGKTPAAYRRDAIRRSH